MEERFDYDGLLGVNSDLREQLADAQATVEALTKERDKAVTRCAHLDILLRDEYLPKLDVEAVKRSIADRDHRIDELEREIEQLDDTVEALQGQVKELEGNRVPHSMQHVIEWQAMNNRLGAQVEALQRERDEAIEAASLPTWVCDGCGRVSSDGWINHVIESLDGTDYEMECPTCGVRDIEEDCALDLVRERDDLQAALDAEREKVKGLEQEAERLRIVNRGHINEGFKDMKTIEELTAAFAKAQAQLSQLQALVRAYFTEPDPHKWTAAYQTLKRMGRALPATPTEELNHPAQEATE